jgi:ligand-binding SRPBCC domain-containing protein
MGMYSIQRSQLVKADIATLWSFFSDARNLAAITPSYMNFVITSPVPNTIYAGQIITYKVSPLLGIPLNWMTEITQVEKHIRFVDEQRIGPYKLWHHEHSFEQTPDGTIMTDTVHYALPFGILGRIAHSLFIKKQLKDIFDYRRDRIEELYNR